METGVIALIAAIFPVLIFYAAAGVILTRLVHKNTNIKYIIKKICIAQIIFLCFMLAVSAVYGGISAAVSVLGKGNISITTIKTIIMYSTGIFTLIILPVCTSVAASFFADRNKGSRYYIISSMKVLILEVINLALGIAVNEILSGLGRSTGEFIARCVIYTVTGILDILIVLKIYGFFDGTKYNRFFSGKTVKAITSVILCLCMTAPMLTPPVITDAATNSTTGRSVNTDFDIDTDKAVMSSAENKKEELTKAPVKYYKQAEPEGELVAASDTSRTYKTGERTYVTRIAGTAAEYKKKDGTYSKIDNTLIEKNGNFQNRANDYTVKLPSEISDGKGINVSKNGKKSIEIIPAGGDFSKSRTSDNAILYNSVFDGVDYQYTVLEDKIKEDIILNKHTDRNTFKFIIRAAGYNVILKNNAVLIYEEDEKTPVYTVAAPVMTDASGNVCFDIKLSMDNSEVSSEYVITMTANSQWLDAVERAYPVRIDPTITIDSDCIGLYCV